MTLDRFQAVLLELLSKNKTAEEIRREFETHSELKEYRDYLEKAESPMLEVAAELVKKWGVQR